MFNRYRWRIFTLLLPAVVFTSYSTPAWAVPFTTELQNYLIIATGDRESGEQNDFEAFDSNSGELGANQEQVSSGSGGAPTQRVRSYTSIGIDLTGTFVETDGATPFNSNNRWTDADPDWSGDTVGVPDFLPGARPLGEAPDQSGNVAITGVNAGFASENTDYHASTGIQCANSPGDCYFSNDSDNSFFGPPDPPQLLPATARVLPRHQTYPGCQFTPRVEQRWIGDRSC